ncbi:hypothetical protein OHS18_12815 [Amycolatopsis sp. NBC_00355]|uniref:hypothetical protein n=1 Tax=Amycolatopsis sp. NBC_00355 TaxID=2975957 RepID=UPI002E262D7D
MPERSPLPAGKLSDLADRVAAQLGPAMLAEDASEPDPLVVAAWHAMNALQRVAELLPGGQLAGEPDTSLRSLNDLASRGENIVQAAMESRIAEAYDAPVVERSGPPDTAKRETATVHLTFAGDRALLLELEGCAQPGEPVRLAGRSTSALRQLDSLARQAVTAAVAEIAHVLVSTLSEAPRM